MQAGLPHLEELGGDLVGTTRWRRSLILARPFGYLALYATCAATGHWALAVVALFFVVVAVVSTMHDLVHGVLGLRRPGTDVALLVFGALVLVSGHAYRRTHQHHHSVFPREDDPEGIAAQWSPLRALLDGPLHVARIWLWAFGRSRGRAIRPWLIAEAMVFGTALAGAAALWPTAARPFSVYIGLVLIGGWLYPLLTVNLPHRHFGETPVTQARTVRGRLLPSLLLAQTYHLEHHLYPRVPSHKLPELARRLDPTLAQLGVHPTRLI